MDERVGHVSFTNGETLDVGHWILVNKRYVRRQMSDIGKPDQSKVRYYTIHKFTINAPHFAE